MKSAEQPPQDATAETVDALLEVLTPPHPIDYFLFLLSVVLLIKFPRRILAKTVTKYCSLLCFIGIFLLFQAVIA